MHTFPATKRTSNSKAKLPVQHRRAAGLPWRCILLRGPVRPGIDGHGKLDGRFSRDLAGPVAGVRGVPCRRCHKRAAQENSDCI